MKAKISFTEKKYMLTLVFVTSLFMFWGIAITMGDVLNKHFQTVLNVSKADSGLVQFSIFGAYFIMSIPAGMFMKKFGYKYGVLLGLILFAAGSFLFIPAAEAQSFSFFRIALFVLGCGLATLETVAHPFMAALGDQRSSDRRVNFAQAFNAVGSMIGPALGTYFLLRGSYNVPTEGLDAVKNLYLGIGAVIILIAVCFSFIKIPNLMDPHKAAEEVDLDAVNIDVAPEKKLFQHRHFVWAVIAQFFNVAAQGGTWAFFINYGHEVMGFSDEKAGSYLVLFMGMMLLGRFVGTFLMRYIAANKLLAIFALANILMCLVVAQGWGWISFAALLSVNFFFSIMFPTIFSLGLKNLGGHTQQASSFISMGVAGAAVFPFFMGLVADTDIAMAYYLPIGCYIVIFLFGAKFYKVQFGGNKAI
ncbi:L-fucose:H+ symporter permease [Sphingobacterium sp. FBM7-1]|uniref:L-fucose:H+ symporter permease n=1 Tax=Sphingobacterium sp. FBM7-1 TaxID=2886688 RepID=UPI001D103C6B|nr:L-fucose:H+ symporter permease [Sphingobacterium sp. FBM7-1]MCC2598569.1 L-fucose:H+ symporter permease [Sphingobacterium sp. FBM7-1]